LYPTGSKNKVFYQTFNDPIRPRKYAHSKKMGFQRQKYTFSITAANIRWINKILVDLPAMSDGRGTTFLPLTKKAMGQNQEKEREPFKPERTPEPPQRKDPRQPMDKNSPDQAKKSQAEDEASSKKKNKESTPGKEKGKPKLLGESETEITDETTI
jgi:hypothetical protein